MSIQIELDLKEVLERIEKRFDKIDERFDKIDADNKDLREVVINIDKRLIKVETKLDSELPAIKDSIRETKDSIKELKSTQQAQIWALIGILFTAVAGFLIAVGKFVLSGQGI